MSYFLLPPKRWFFPSNKRIFNNQILVEIQRNLSSAERNSKHTLRYEKSQSTKINRISLFPSKSYFDNDSYNKSIQNNTNCNNSHHNHNVSVIFPTFKTSNISKSNNRMGIVRRFYSKKVNDFNNNNTFDITKINTKSSSPGSFLSSMFNNNKTNQKKPKINTESVIYKGHFVIPLRIIMRLKLIHAGVLTTFTGCWLTFPGFVDGELGKHTAGILIIFSAFLLASTPLARAYIGRIYFDNCTGIYTISTLSFWGQRVDKRYHLKDIEPIFASHRYSKDIKELPLSIITRINAKNDTYLLSTYMSESLNEQALLALLTGNYDKNLNKIIK